MVRRRLLGIGFAVLSTAVANAGDPDAGARVFKKCAACHAVGENAPIKLGPALNGLIGRTAGTYPGYNYTDANRDSGLVWDERTLARYLRNPQDVIPGTKMIFAGLRRESEIEDVIAYLRQFGPGGKPGP